TARLSSSAQSPPTRRPAHLPTTRPPATRLARGGAVMVTFHRNYDHNRTLAASGAVVGEGRGVVTVARRGWRQEGARAIPRRARWVKFPICTGSSNRATAQ